MEWRRASPNLSCADSTRNSSTTPSTRWSPGFTPAIPYKLSVTHAFPKLKALEDNYGSMIKGQIFGARERKKRGEVAKDRAPKFSFDEGLQVLPDALAQQLGDSIN